MTRKRSAPTSTSCCSSRSNTTEVTGRDLYDLLGKSILDDKDYTFTVTVDSEDRYNTSAGAAGIPDVFNETYMKRDNKATLGRTGNGVLT